MADDRDEIIGDRAPPAAPPLLKGAPTPRQLYGMKGMLRYLVGLRGHSNKVLPKWAEQYTLHGLDRDPVDDLNRFKNQPKAGLDMAPQLVRYLYEALHAAYHDADDMAQEHMYDFYQYTYGRRLAMSMTDLKMWLLDGHKAWPGEALLDALPGVYQLYRADEPGADGRPSVVRSLLMIVDDEAVERRYLRFKISYISTGHALPAVQDIDGIVLDKRPHFLLLGTDYGFDMPYLVTARAPSNSEPAQTFSGLFTKLGRSDTALAARIVAVRQRLSGSIESTFAKLGDAQETAPAVLDYAAAEQAFDDKPHLLWSIDNTVDPTVHSALWEPLPASMPRDWRPPQRRP